MKDVIIVGGGIIGMLTARTLHDAGLDVMLIDQGELVRNLPGRVAGFFHRFIRGIITRRLRCCRNTGSNITPRCVKNYKQLPTLIRNGYVQVWYLLMIVS